MQLIKLLGLSDLFGITLLLASLLFSSCATTGDLNLMRDDLNKAKKEIQEVQEKANKLEKFSYELRYNLLKLIEIYNNHIEEFHRGRKIFN